MRGWRRVLRAGTPLAGVRLIVSCDKLSHHSLPHSAEGGGAGDGRHPGAAGEGVELQVAVAVGGGALAREGEIDAGGDAEAGFELRRYVVERGDAGGRDVAGAGGGAGLGADQVLDAHAAGHGAVED